METSGGNSPEWAECEKFQHLLNNQWHKHIRFQELSGPADYGRRPLRTQVVKLQWYRRSEPQWEMAPGGLDHNLPPEDV